MWLQKEKVPTSLSFASWSSVLEGMMKHLAEFFGYQITTISLDDIHNEKVKLPFEEKLSPDDYGVY